jgi:tetratricopeptide (TPR) repeat protein
MGVVYRATDRLIGAEVALKSLTSSAMGMDRRELGMLLAREFQILSSLRHPYIVSVLDYGIDSGGDSFYSMEILEGAQDILTATKGESIDAKLQYLAQVTQAIHYLHANGIIHRDLTSNNILVSEGCARVVDFGLSLRAELAAHELDTVSGTLSYVAPEVLLGESPPSVLSDLYSFGVIASEILLGRNLAKDIMLEWSEEGFDLSELEQIGLPYTHVEHLQRLLSSLIAKNPRNRINTARHVLDQLNQMLGMSARAEVAPVRESFLQSAKFVGRSSELQTVSRSIGGAGGSSWLVMGESGVGKSRFVNELRPTALVAGVLVFRGAANSESEDRYAMWRDIVRALLIETTCSAEHAAWLRLILQDVNSVHGLEVPPTPALAPGPAQVELFASLEALLAGLARPSMVILEDLHWAGSESVALLNHLIARLGDKPVVFVLTMRNDEAQAEKAVRGARVIELDRLNKQEIHQLTAGMLGDGNVSHRLVDQLYEQSEGNAFFLVESLRALAEEAGRLDRVGIGPTASSITSKGVQDLIDRRLGRLPASCQPLLELAALMGRRLNLSVLAALEPQTNVDGWLMSCAQAALLDVQDQVWQFKHEKIREGIVGGISCDRRVDLHRRIARAIESTSPDPTSQCVELMRHWGEGDMPQKELDCAKAAIQQAIGKNAITEAVQYLKRAIVLTRRLPEGPARDADELGLQLQFGGLLAATAGFGAPEVLHAFEDAQRLCANLGDDGSLIPVYWGLWSFFTVRMESKRALQLGDAITRRGQASGVASVVRLGGHLRAATQFWKGELQGLERPFEEFLAGLDRRGSQEVQVLSYLAWLLWLRGRPDEAEEKSEQAIAVAQTLERRDHLAFALGFAAQYSAYRRDFKRASLLADASITLAEKHGFPFWLGAARILRGSVMVRSGKRRDGIAELEEGLQIYSATGARVFRPSFLLQQAQAYVAADDHQTARKILEKAKAEIAATGERINEVEILRNLGEIAYRLGETDPAEETLEAAIAVARRQGALAFELRSTISLAWLLRGVGRKSESASRLKHVCEAFPIDCSWTELTAARALLQQFSS